MGLLLRTPRLIGDVVGEVAPEDFYEPLLARWYGLMLELWEEGSPVLNDPVILPRWLIQRSDEPDDFVVDDWAALLDSDGASDPVAAASIVSDLGRRRRLQGLASAAVDKAADQRLDLQDVADELCDAMGQLDRAVDRSELITGHDLVSDDLDDPVEWIVPGFIGRQDRMILVAPGGSGKSYLIRYFAVSTLIGRNPLTGQEFETYRPRVLIIDLENPRRVIRDGFRSMMRTAQLKDPECLDRIAVRSYPRQIDLRSRTDRAMVEMWIAEHSPDLVCFGPAYKAIHSPRPNENEQNAATVLTGIIDDLRDRYNFAFILEHHGAKADRSGAPMGTSVWEWWAEFGRGLTPLDQNGDVAQDVRFTKSLEVKAWRGDRIPVPWPKRFDRTVTSPWPFNTFWPDGMPPKIVEGGRGEIEAVPVEAEPLPPEPPPDDPLTAPF